MWNESAADSAGTSHMQMRGGGSSESEVPFLRPVMGKELSSVQFRSLEEQLFRAMAVLHDQEQRHGVARIVGNKQPVTLVTPMIEVSLADRKMVKSFLNRKYRKLPFALKNVDAHKAITDREEKMARSLLQAASEPTEIKRRADESKESHGWVNRGA